jgi:hypothetical protein
MEALSSSETSVFTRSTRRNIPEDDILHTKSNVKMSLSVSGSGLQLNQTVNGTEGFLSSPNFPGNYYHDLDYWVHLVSPERTRLVVQLHHLDLELQNECLYDFIELTSIGRDGQLLSDAVRWCGNHHSETER